MNTTSTTYTDPITGETLTINNPPQEQWAIVELMGHVKYGGRVSKDTAFGTGLIRLDVPQEDGSEATQLINPSSLYRLTFCTKELATAAAKLGNPKPYSDWEMKHVLKLDNGETPVPSAPSAYFFGDDDDHHDDDDEDLDRP